MAGLYQSYRRDMLEGDAPPYITGDIRTQLIDVNDYTVDLANHQFLSSIPAGARVGPATALTGKTATNGVADADNTIIPNVPGPDPLEALVIYEHTGSDATARLMAYIDQGPNWPLTPNNNQVEVQWANDANRIYSI